MTIKHATSKGIEFGTLAQTMYRVYQESIEIGPDPLDRLSEIQQHAWGRAAMHAIALLDNDEGPDTSFPALADEIYWSWAGVARPACYEQGGVRPQFASLPLLERLGWEAVARHLAGVMDAEDPVAIEVGEQTFKGWASKNLKGRAEVEARQTQGA